MKIFLILSIARLARHGIVRVREKHVGYKQGGKIQIQDAYNNENVSKIIVYDIALVF